MLTIPLLKIFLPTVLAFFIGIFLTPFWANYLYRHQMWKKRAGKITPDGRETPIFNQLHKEKEVGTPRMGGVIIWASVLITTAIFWLLPVVFPNSLLEQINFLSRNQTWLPVFTLLIGSLVGLLDDFLQVRPAEDVRKAGLPFSQRLLVVLILAMIGAYWFYFKLGVNAVTVPFLGEIFIGWLFIPLFVGVMVFLFSSGVIDGLDGLSGGVMTIIFSAYAVLAFAQHQYDLSALCTVISGGTLAFLWFNIPPARFYMSETGILGLTTTLTVVAFLTDSVITLPIIALPLIITSLSVIIQLVSKKLRNGKKVFKVAPLHHHFEAIGWPAYKVVMRYWVISIIFAIIGLILTLVGKTPL